MHDKDEIEGLLVGDTIEDEHRLDGEVPGACTVGGGHDDGDGAYDERDKGAGEPEVGGGVEAEEGEVVVDEVTAPDGEGVEDEEGLVAHAAQRHHSLPDASEGGAYLIIYAEAAQQEMEEHQGGDGAHGGDEVAGEGEAGEDGVDAGAGLLEEGAEDGHLAQQHHGGDKEHEEGVDGALGDHGAE